MACVDQHTTGMANRSAGRKTIRGGAGTLAPPRPVIDFAPSCGGKDSYFHAECGRRSEEITETEKEWLDRARRTVLVALRTRFGVSKEQATDAIDDAVRRIVELLKHGVGFPYPTSVLMCMSRLVHARLNQ